MSSKTLKSRCSGKVAEQLYQKIWMIFQKFPLVTQVQLFLLKKTSSQGCLQLG